MHDQGEEDDNAVLAVQDPQVAVVGNEAMTRLVVVVHALSLVVGEGGDPLHGCRPHHYHRSPRPAVQEEEGSYCDLVHLLGMLRDPGLVGPSKKAEVSLGYSPFYLAHHFRP